MIKALLPTDLGLILSYQCQAACDHCLFNCGPGWKDWMGREGMEEALQAYRRGTFPDLIRLLLEGGPHQLARWAQTQAGYEPIREGYAGKCHLCVDVRKHLATCESYPELQPPEFYSNF